MKGPIEFRLYSEEELKSNFEQLREEFKTFQRKSVLSTDDILSVNKAIAEKSGGFPMFTINITDVIGGLTIYRVSKGAHITTESRTKPSTFSFPKCKDKVKMGRANIQGDPVFYGAILPGTAVEECNVQPGEEYYISEWKFHPSSKDLYAFLITYDSQERAGMFDEMTKKNLDILTKGMDETMKASFIKKYRTVIDQFTEPSKEYYSITSAIAHHRLYLLRDKIVETPIIIYPSVNKLENEYNMAIHPALAGNPKRLELQTVLRCIKGDTEYDVAFLEKGVSHNGKISWNQIGVNDVKLNISVVEVTTDVGKGFRYSMDTMITMNKVRQPLYLLLEKFVKNHLKPYALGKMAPRVKRDIVFSKTNNTSYETFCCPFKEEARLDCGHRVTQVDINFHYGYLLNNQNTT